MPLNFQVLRRYLLQSFQKKTHDMEIENKIIHQDNTPTHRASDTLMTTDFNVGFEKLEHSPNSPDLSPMDFAVFQKLKYHLKGKHSTEMRMAVRSFFITCDDSWYIMTYSRNGWTDTENALHVGVSTSRKCYYV